MPRGKSDQNRDILEYALQHLERERDELQNRIDIIRRQLGVRATATSSNHSQQPVASAPARKKRTLSEAARKRIAAAQKRRWAEHRKQLKSKSAAE